MKIIQITPYFPPHLGGMENRVKDLSEYLSQKGHKVIVFTSKVNGKNYLPKSNNLSIEYLNNINIAHTPISFSLVKKLFKLDKNCIFHIHAVDAFYPPIAYLISRIRKIPYILHIRGNIQPSGKFGFLLPLYKKLFLNKILNKANKVIALNKDYKKLFCTLYNLPPKNVSVIPNATSFRPNKYWSKKKSKEINLLFVGRFSIDKNIPLIIESLDFLHKKNKNIKLYLVGEGEDKEDLKKMVNEKGLKESVIFLGRLEGEDLYRRYSKSDIVILPSKVECFSSVLLEAMTMAKPIIASNVEGTRNIIKNNYNGILIKPTPEKIAEAVEKLIKNPRLRERLVKNGLKEIKRYSWDKVVKQTEEVYREVLKEHNEKQKTKSKTNS